MAYLEPKLVTKLAQKQVLTPGLVQMVSLLTLNKLELTEMIQQELVQNPVLEEGTEIVENIAPEIELGQDSPDRPARPPKTWTGPMPNTRRYGKPPSATIALQNPRRRGSTVEAAASRTRAGDGRSICRHRFSELRSIPERRRIRPRETEIFEKPSFENFLAKPQTLTDHLEWQLGLATVEEKSASPAIRSSEI